MATNLSQSDIQSLITATALQYGVDPALALAVAKTESNFNPNAVSPVNNNGSQDFGVMQINSSNFASLGITDPTDPQQNITAGIQLLAQYSRQYNGNPQQILWAYNAGPGAVASGNLPSSTASYIPTVLDNMSLYTGIVPDSSSVYSSTEQTVNIMGQDVPLSYAIGGAVAVLAALWFALGR